MKVVVLEGRARAIRCMHQARHRVWLLQVVDALSWQLLGADKGSKPKTADVAREVDDGSFEDGCIRVYTNLCSDVRLHPHHPEIDR